MTCWIHGGLSTPTATDTVCDYKVLCYLYVWYWPLTYMDNCASECEMEYDTILYTHGPSLCNEE
jgi:hypothetical protein